MQGALAGVGGEAGGQVVELGPDCLRFGGGEFGFVVQEEESRPDVQVGARVAASIQAALSCKDVEGSSPGPAILIAFTRSSTSA